MRDPLMRYCRVIASSFYAFFMSSLVLGSLLLTIQDSLWAQEGPGYSDNNIVNGMFRPISPEEEAHSRSMPPPARTSGVATGQLMVLDIPKSFTGTDEVEKIEYQLPQNYDPLGTPHPLLVCWHGYGSSCHSVANKSRIDEECFSNRGWIFLSVTGKIQTNFAYLDAQLHCTKAIEYLLTQLNYNIDTDRIYMAGFSMGGGAAASYASRHMATGEGYPIAGLIIIAGAADWTYTYNVGDPGALLWLPVLFGGTPLEEPFAYKQVSALFVDNFAYLRSESAAQNLRHNVPIFLTYADNDPLTYGPFLNEQLATLLTDIGANVMVDHYVSHPDPHGWGLLDIDVAFDFIEGYDLTDQETDSIDFLADRDAAFYWNDVTQNAVGLFSEVEGTVDSVQNALNISEASNCDSLHIDCTATGLDDSQDLMIEFASSFSGSQTLELEPLPSEPNYVVDSTTGVLYTDYTYDDVGDVLSLTRDPLATLDLRVSYVPFDLNLSVPDTVQLSNTLTVDLDSGPAGENYLLIFSRIQQEMPVEDRYILLAPVGPGTLWRFGILDGAGNDQLNIQVPSTPGLAGKVFYAQTLTYDISLTGISNLDSVEILP